MKDYQYYNDCNNEYGPQVHWLKRWLKIPTWLGIELLISTAVFDSLKVPLSNWRKKEKQLRRRVAQLEAANQELRRDVDRLTRHFDKVHECLRELNPNYPPF